MPEEKIRTWASHFRLHGIDGLRPKRSVYGEVFKLSVLIHQDREQLLIRQVSAVYNIRNCNQVVVWRRNLDQGVVQDPESSKQGHPTMKLERCCPAPLGMVTADPVPALLEENQRLRAEVAYLKKLQALIRAKRSAAPTKRN